MSALPTHHFGALLALLPAVLALTGTTTNADDYIPRNDPTRVQHLVDDLTRRLALSASVIPKVVPRNTLLVSVEPQEGREKTFLLSFEDDFLGALDDDELRAVVAHELGHVWIFTHHPYLQTESLANSVAMRVVSRESLEKVYMKVWERGGAKGDIARFLGQ